MRSSPRLLALSRPIVMVVILAWYMANTDHDSARMALYAVSAAFFFTSSTILVGWIPAPRRSRAGLLILEIVLATFLNWTDATHLPGGPMPALYMPIVVTLPLQLDRRLWAPTAFGLAAGWLASSLLAWRQLPASLPYLQFFLYGSLLLFAGSAGLLLRSLQDEQEHSARLLHEVRESQAALERAHHQLQESAARQQEMAVLEERQRLAREIHDSVAHGLTALVVQIQAARRLLEAAPGQAAETIARCEEITREALQETRLAVRALHPSGLEEQDDLTALRRLGRDFGLATGMTVDVTADAAAAALPPDPARMEQLYRIFQEALTNAHRHGQARRVTAHLSGTKDEAAESIVRHLHLSIHNDGHTPESLDPGLGLRAMSERARSLGGSVRFEPDDPGFTIHVTVPIPGEAVS